MSDTAHSTQALERPEFIEYFFKSRLKRVPMEVLRKFVLDLSGKDEQEKLSKAPQKDLIDKIIYYREFRGSDKDFNLKFNQFIRDHLFSANESVYLIQMPNQQAVIDWINAWIENKYSGQRFHFSKHTHVLLQERFLMVDKSKVPFPSDVILVVANSIKPKIIPSGLDLVEIFPTVEIEMVFRKGINLMEARGDLGVILDFINTATLDANNPFAQARSYFVGEKEQAKSKAITKAKNK
jgi:hypothetical protein